MTAEQVCRALNQRCAAVFRRRRGVPAVKHTSDVIRYNQRRNAQAAKSHKRQRQWARYLIRGSPGGVRVRVIQFGIESLMHDDRGLIVCGMCLEAEFGLGDVFTELHRIRAQRDPQTKCLEPVTADIDAAVRLRVDEIGFYGRTVERLGIGHTAGIRFSGDGLEKIKGLDLAADLRAGKLWSLYGG